MARPARIAGQVLPPTLRARLDPIAGSSKLTQNQLGGVGIEPEGEGQVVQGWLKSVRAHKNVVFAELSDGSTSESLQAVFKGAARAEWLDAGASVRLTGRWVQSRGAGQASEFLVDKTDILGSCDPETYPIQKKSLPPPVLREMAHLRFRTTQTAAVMRVRDAMMRDWHDWFEENEFVHVHTPLLTSSDCEGAGETFAVTVAPGEKDKGKGKEEPFFPSPVNLTVSSQLHLEAPTHSLSRTYTLSPAFRAEPSLTSRHLSEFYMLEGEVVLSSLEELMDVVEDGIRSVLGKMLTGEGRRAQATRRDLQRLEEDVTEGGKLAAVAAAPFRRLTYTQAIQELRTRHAAMPFDIPPKWSEGLASEHEKYLAGEYGPTFVTHYPRHLKPFYMLPSDSDPSFASSSTTTSIPAAAADGQTVSCFDLLFPEVGELAGGSMREHRLTHLECALDAHGLDKERYGWYLDLRRYGSVPHGGWGMGWDRWISWVTGVGNLRDVVAYPRWKGHCDY